eukprot:UN05520
MSTSTVRPHTRNRFVVTGMNVVRLLGHVKLSMSATKELKAVWNDRKLLAYNDNLSNEQVHILNMQTYFSFLDLIREYWINPTDLISMGHHVSAAVSFQYYVRRGKMSDGVPLFFAMTNQISAAVFDLCNILILHKQHKFAQRALTYVARIMLLFQMFYRIPILFWMATYKTKFLFDTNYKHEGNPILRICHFLIFYTIVVIHLYMEIV